MSSIKLVSLPHIHGFANHFFKEPKLKPETEHLMAGILGHARFQKGALSARVYANLVVLIRMLLFYDTINREASFWQWVAADWGIDAQNHTFVVRSIVEVYSDARAAWKQSPQKRQSLLVRLVDEWLHTRPQADGTYLTFADSAQLDKLHDAWCDVRDKHVDVLMDSKYPMCLVGAALPPKIVTSLWEQDPAVTRLIAEIAPKRKTKSGPANQLATNADDLKPEFPRVDKRKDTESRKADGAKLGLKRRKTSDAKVLDLSALDPAANSPVERLKQKKSKKLADKDIAEGFRRLFQFFEDDADAPATPPKKPIPTEVVDMTVEKTERLSEEPRLQHVPPIKRDDMRAQLLQSSELLQRRRDEINARSRMETTGFFPDARAGGTRDVSADASFSDAGSSFMPREERDMYESKIRKLEERLASLEQSHKEESYWARAMGRFLYDANERSLASFTDVFDALEKTSSMLLQASPKRK